MKHQSISQKEASACTPIQGRIVPPRRILLVEDNQDIRNLNAEVLADSGYQVDTANDGVSGWKALQARHYDVLITDNTMPGVTGLELIKQLRSEDMSLAVILASGTAPTEELTRNPWLHIDALLPKPYRTADLVKIVGEVLHNSDTSS